MTLNAPAPTGGVAVSLASNNAAATVPSSVTVAANATSATFPLTTSPVTAVTPVSLTATYNGSVTATLTVAPHQVIGLTLNPPTVVGGNISVATVTLNGAAPAGGTRVTLTSGNAAVSSIDAYMIIGPGATNANAAIYTTSAVTTSISGPITASYNGSVTATLTVTPP